MPYVWNKEYTLLYYINTILQAVLWSQFEPFLLFQNNKCMCNLHPSFLFAKDSSDSYTYRVCIFYFLQSRSLVRWKTSATRTQTKRMLECLHMPSIDFLFKIEIKNDNVNQVIGPIESRKRIESKNFWKKFSEDI